MNIEYRDKIQNIKSPTKMQPETISLKDDLRDFGYLEGKPLE